MTCDRARRDELYWAFTGEERFYDDDDDDADVESVFDEEEGAQELLKDKSECLFSLVSASFTEMSVG